MDLIQLSFPVRISRFKNCGALVISNMDFLLCPWRYGELCLVMSDTPGVFGFVIEKMELLRNGGEHLRMPRKHPEQRGRSRLLRTDDHECGHEPGPPRVREPFDRPFHLAVPH